MLTMAQIQNIRFLRNHKGLSLRAVVDEVGFQPISRQEAVNT